MDTDGQHYSKICNFLVDLFSWTLTDSAAKDCLNLLPLVKAVYRHQVDATLHTKTMQCSTDKGKQASAAWPTCGISRGSGFGQRQRPAPLRRRNWPRRYRHWRTRPLLLHVWLVWILHKGTVYIMLHAISITSVLHHPPPPLCPPHVKCRDGVHLLLMTSGGSLCCWPTAVKP